MKLPKDFKELLNIFNDNHVEYLIVGGYAVAYYGYVRATNDIDIWISNEKSNIQRVIKSLMDFGFPKGELKPDAFEKNDRIIRMGVPPFRIELLTGVSGLNFKETFPTRKIVQIDDIDISIIDLEHLKINKKAAGRYKDLDDLENI